MHHVTSLPAMPQTGCISYACLAVTCHLHFWQKDRDLLRAASATRQSIQNLFTCCTVSMHGLCRVWSCSWLVEFSRAVHTAMFALSCWTILNGSITYKTGSLARTVVRGNSFVQCLGSGELFQTFVTCCPPESSWLLVCLRPGTEGTITRYCRHDAQMWR